MGWRRRRGMSQPVCRLGCRFSVPGVLSFGVFCAVYMCLVIEIWIIINNYMLFISLMGKGKVDVYCCYSFVSGFVTCRRLSVHGVTVHVLFYCKCEFLSLGALFLLCGFTFSSLSI